jgi:hypothetical protein
MVHKYNGKILVDIREVCILLCELLSSTQIPAQFYEDKMSGEWKPGKKGASLSTEEVSQYPVQSIDTLTLPPVV